MLITIDGPAGAGKTTVSRMLAERLNYTYVDTGALYRGVAVAVKDAGIDAADEPSLDRLCAELRFEFRRVGGDSRLFLNGRDIGDRIRTPEISMLASAVSARPAVRKRLLSIQRALGAKKAAVFEGRDMGTVVFPDADVKFFLDADVTERAKRRYIEFAGRNDQSLESVESEMKQRDHNDRSRPVAPLKPAEDATVIDATHISADEVVEIMMDRIDKKPVGTRRG